MSEYEYLEEARRAITSKCLIATDVDKTILQQSQKEEEERLEFLRESVSQLAQVARQGSSVALLTGNSMHQMCSRVLNWLTEWLCQTRELELIGRFHFFCCSGGVYFHLDPQHDDLREVLGTERDHHAQHAAFRDVIQSDQNGELCILPQFVDPTYVERCLILAEHAGLIEEILANAADWYWDELNNGLDENEKVYDLEWIRDKETKDLVKPEAESRTALYGPKALHNKATVQITLKPILSFRQAKCKCEDRDCDCYVSRERLIRYDWRTRVIERIQAELDCRGLDHYVARPGGRASIDVTLDTLDKAYALEFLIDRLKVHGNSRRGQEVGSNTIYFGDEVIVGGGNDYPVVRIPGLLVIAVNLERELVPFLHEVFVPSKVFVGPKATARMLTQYNERVDQLVGRYVKGRGEGESAQMPRRNAIEEFKIRLFKRRIDDKLTRMAGSKDSQVDDWQTLHTFTTLLGRNDATARKCLGMLVRQLDGFLSEIAESGGNALRAIGDSHFTTD